MMVDGIRENLQSDIEVVRDRVEQSLGTANSVASSFKDLITGRVLIFVNTGVPPTVSESVTNEQIVPARAASSIDESA